MGTIHQPQQCATNFTLCRPVPICFLQSLLEQGASYGSINATRSLLSACLQGNTPSSPGFLRVSPTCGPRGHVTRRPGTSVALHYLKAWGPTDELPLDKLTKRLLLIFLLATGQRLQALHHLKAEDISWGPEECTIVYTTKLKTNDPQKNPLQLHLGLHWDHAFHVLHDSKKRGRSWTSWNLLFIFSVTTS